MTFIERVQQNPREYIVSCLAGAIGANFVLQGLGLDDALKAGGLGYIADNPSLQVLDLLGGCFAGVMAYDG